MPGYKSHIVGGIAAHVLLHSAAVKIFSHQHPDIKKLILALTFSILGALFPDIDTKSVGQRIFYALLTIPILFTIFSHRWELLAILSLISLFPILVNHRGIIHTIWFVTVIPLAIPIVVYFSNPHVIKLAWFAYYYFVGGALSHLMLDYGVFRTLKRTCSW